MDTDIKTPAKILVICCVIFLSIITSTWMLNTKPLGDHESFVAITAREMLQSGDWVVPACNGELRLQKTPLNYWMVASLAKISGEVNEFNTRFPNAILAILTTIAILYFVNRSLGFRTAAISALVWSSTLCYYRYTHSGRPEMSLAAFVAIAMLSFYAAMQATERKRQVAYMLIFWISFALAMLAKGPAPLPLIAAPIFFYILIFRKWKTIPKMLPITGAIIFFVIILPWPILLGMRLYESSASAEQGFLSFWKTEFIDRFFGNYAAGNKSWYFFFYVMFQLILPWVVFLPIALAAPFYKVWGKKQKIMLCLWLWFVVDVAIMSISGGKRRHYILPAMPAMTILIGTLLEDMIFARKAYAKTFTRNILLLHIIPLTVAAITAPIYTAIKYPHLFGPTTVLALIVLLTITLILLSFAKNKKHCAAAAIFIGCCTTIIAAATWPITSSGSTEHLKPFAKEFRQTVPQTDELIVFGNIPMRVTFYLDRITPTQKDTSKAFDSYQQNNWGLAIGSSAEQLAKDDRFTVHKMWKEAITSHGEFVPVMLFHKP